MSNHQVSLRSATESCQIISRDLALERIRVQDLEARLKELHPSIETLLQNIHLDQPHVPDPEFSSQQQTIQYQQELICSLQGIIRAREEMIEELGLSLDDVFEDALGDHGGQEAPHRPKEEGAPLPESPESGFSIDIITE